VDLLPLKAAFAAGEAPVVELLDAPAGATLEVFRLEQRVHGVEVEAGTSVVTLPELAVGGYGVELRTPDGRSATTALDVLEHPFQRLRYGFASDFAPGRDPGAAVRTARRLHLNATQLYDWMYRHARLLPPADTFADALGRELSLFSVRDLARALHEAGSAPLAYAAVYAVGRQELGRFEDAELRRSDGRPWQLGEDFLWLVDPADAAWSEHLLSELQAALRAVGVAGFHLDQYGWPKRALRRDGVQVDLAGRFAALLQRAAAALPGAALVFNNVNDFPTWETTRAPGAATYIEVWPPHDGLEHLAALATRARALAPRRPVVLAAYPSVLASAPEEAARPALELLLATAFSHGATVLAAGEEDGVLVDPYYPRYHHASAETQALLRRFHDLLVRLGDVLVTDAQDVTRSYAGGINEEVAVAAAVPVNTDPVAGGLWLRVVDTAEARVLHLINLTGQEDTRWDAPRAPIASVAGAELHLRRERREAPAVFAASPAAPRLTRLHGRNEGDVDVFTLPPLGAWTVLVVR
jgi:dextranase